jgi:RHS repeat-associated protein
VTTTYGYRADGLVARELTSGGARTEYIYDDNGNLEHKYSYYDTTGYNHEHFTYDSMDRAWTKSLDVQERDIQGYPDSMAALALTSSYAYDKNGNILAATDQNGVTTTYTYDLMDRAKTTSQPGVDENNLAVAITTSAAYDWAGNVLTATDELGRATRYEYDKRGFLKRVRDAMDYTRYFTYDRAGRKTAEVNPNHYHISENFIYMTHTRYEYDKMGRLLLETQACRGLYFNWTIFVSRAHAYDGNGNVILEQDALGYQGGYGTIYEYDKQGRQTKAIDPEGQLASLPHTTLTAYDGLGRATSVTDANGVATEYVHDDDGNVLTVHVGGVQTQGNTYNLLGELMASTDGNGNTSAFEYNAMGKLRGTTLPGDATIGAYTVAYKYTKTGLPAVQTDSLGKQAIIEYDNQGRVLSTTERTSAGAEAVTVSSRYDKTGNARYVFDGNGNRTENTYDGLNRKATATIIVTDALNNPITCTTTYSYDALGNLRGETDWRGNARYYVRDALERLVETRRWGGTVEMLEYDDNGSQISSTDALFNKTEFRYDRNGRLTETIDGELNSQSRRYDAVGNVVLTIDGNDNSTHYEYDGFNRLRRVENALNEVTEYTYDANGNMLTQTDGAGNATTTQYNARNLPIARIEPGGIISGGAIDNARAMRYTYRADGSVEAVTDQNGVVTSYAYDIHGRVLAKTAGTKSVSYGYDNNGNILTQSDVGGTTVRTYDELGRTTTKAVPGIGTATYLYDITAGLQDGYLAQTTTDPKGNSTTKVYDPKGRLYQVRSGAAATTYTYYANGNRKSMTYPNGVIAEYTYYADNRLHTLANSRGGAYLSTFNYAYDGNGNMTAKLEMKGGTTYSYDALGRAETVEEPGGKITGYTYDAAGNRKTETITDSNGVTVTEYDYSDHGRLMSAVETTGDYEKASSFQYDNNGSQISMMVSTIADATGNEALTLAEPGDGTGDEPTYEIDGYDEFGQLVSVTSDNYVASYGYNADGLRVSKEVTQGGAAESAGYLYEGDLVTLEVDGSGSQVAYNVYGADSIISRTTAGGAAYYVYNGRGDVVQLVAFGGTIAAEYDYDAFGNLLEEHLSDTNPFRYCGEYWDDETKNYYLRSRYYKPKTGRFTQRDSYLGRYTDPLSLNRYTYGHNNPIKYRDSTGHNASGINFGPNEGADWLRTGSGKTFEEFWGVGPYGTPVTDNLSSGGSSSSGSGSSSKGNNGVNFGPNEGADWLRTGSGLSFEEYWGVGPYGTPLSNGSPLSNPQTSVSALSINAAPKPSSSGGGKVDPWAQGVPNGVDDFAKKYNASWAAAYVFDSDAKKYVDVIFITAGNGTMYTLLKGTDYELVDGVQQFKSTSDIAGTARIAVIKNEKSTPSGGKAMIDYIAAKNGGSFAWNNKEQTSATVTINGKTVTYKAGDPGVQIAQVNGWNKIVVPSGKIANDFSVYGTNTFSTVYDRFSTMDAAAAAFGLSYRQASFDADSEYTAFIYYDDKNKNYLFGNYDIGSDTSGAWPGYARGYTGVAWIHTHGSWNGNGTKNRTNQRVFTGSGGDVDAAIGWYDYNGMSYAYLINNEGVLKRLDVASIKGTSYGWYIWDKENKGPNGVYSTAVDIIGKGLK